MSVSIGTSRNDNYGQRWLLPTSQRDTISAVPHIHLPLKERLGIPGLHHLGRTIYTSVASPFEPHAHPGEIEICLVARGTQRYVIDDSAYDLRAHAVFIAYPGEEHATGMMQERSKLYVLRIGSRLTQRGYLGLSGNDARAMLDSLLSIPAHSFPVDTRTHLRLDAVIDLYRTKDALRNVRIQSLVISFLLEIIDAAKRTTVRGRSPAMTRVIDSVEHSVEDRIALSALAAQAKLSLPHFKKRFTREIGIPPREYVLRRKIERAKELLRGNTPVTDIAYQLAFSSGNYFATVFRRFTGMSPQQFREQ